MTHLVAFNDEHVICSSIFNVDKHTELQYTIPDLITPYGFFIPLGETGMVLHRMIQAPFDHPIYGTFNRSLLPPHGTIFRGVLVGMTLEMVTFNPSRHNENDSVITTVPLPSFSKKWKVMETGSYHHDAALAATIEKCKDPKEVVARLNKFTAGKLIDPLIFNLEKVRALGKNEKWKNVKSTFISHEIEMP